MILALFSACHQRKQKHTDWRVYGGSSDNIKYSDQDQIEIPSFGKDGGIDLSIGLGRDEKTVPVSPTSPVAVYKTCLL